MRFFFIFLAIASLEASVATSGPLEWEILVDEALIERRDGPNETQGTAAAAWNLFQAQGITKEERQQIPSFILPNNHPAKGVLDELCSLNRVTANLKSLRKAGFQTSGVNPGSKVVVATHPRLQGYIVKLYLDDQPIDGTARLLERCIGARIASKIIQKHHYSSIMKVPAKWLYPLPPLPTSGTAPQQFILVAEKIELVSQKDNDTRWRFLIPKKTLNAIYVLLTEGGFYDMAHSYNMPFAKDGKIALVDTEQYGQPINYHKLDSSLGEAESRYWDWLILNKGPPHVPSDLMPTELAESPE